MGSRLGQKVEQAFSLLLTTRAVEVAVSERHTVGDSERGRTANPLIRPVGPHRQWSWPVPTILLPLRGGEGISWKVEEEMREDSLTNQTRPSIALHHRNQGDDHVEAVEEEVDQHDCHITPAAEIGIAQCDGKRQQSQGIRKAVGEREQK